MQIRHLIYIIYAHYVGSGAPMGIGIKPEQLMCAVCCVLVHFVRSST